MSTPALHRYHALDALRAAMMLLGIVLHCAVSYGAIPLGEAWPYKDPSTSGLFDLVVFFIHLFRMPIFFVVAGFFAAMLFARDGATGFIVNRAKRVLLPLTLFWLPVYTGVAAGFTFAVGRASGAVDMTPITSGAFLQKATLAHLWFLWDLMLFYAAAVALVPLARLAPPHWFAWIDRTFATVATSVAGAVTMAALSTLTLLPMEKPALDTSLALLPPLRVLLAYGVFFVFGWLLYRRRDLVEPFGRRWKIPTAVGVIASIAYLIVTVGQSIPDPRTAHIIGCALAALAIWMLIFGIMGAFVAFLHRPRPVIRYLSDASYWMYVIHLPFAIALAGLLAPLALPAVLKFAITLGSVTAIVLISYHYAVRSTAIGALLNGRRYARTLPEAEPAREMVAV